MTSVRVHIHNQTHQPLALVGPPWTDGDWLGGPPGRIEPGQVAVTGSESDDFATGTEGRLTYQIGDDPSAAVYVHWNNPFSGANSYHTNTDDGHYAFWGATGQGDATANFVLRPAGETWTDFLPSRDAFRFGNFWEDPTPYTLPPLRGTVLDQKYGNAGSGLCGGMVFGALDYFSSNQRIPQLTDAPAGEQDPFFLYLVDRLFATFDPASISLLLGLMLPLFPDGDEAPLSALGLASCRASVMAFQEWPLIRADIDAGKPSPVVLQTVKSLLPWDLGQCHQVLAYAYDVHGHTVTLRLYDPNTPPTGGDPEPADGVYLRFQDGDVSNRIVVEHNVNIKNDDKEPLPIYCFARMNYAPVWPVIGTQPRLPGAEIAHRRVSVVVSAPERVASEVVESGRRVFEIWPDCGTAEMAYDVRRERWGWGLTYTPIGFYDPVVEWTMGDVPVPAGGLTDSRLPGVTVFQPRPVAAGALTVGRGTTEVRDVAIRTTWVNNNLTLYTTAADGNYALPLKVTCRERVEADPPWSRTFPLEVEGWREEVPGLSEAIGQCFKNYVDRQRAGPDDQVQALADLIGSQLGRPGNPLLDPDPTWVSVTAAMVQEDPRLAEATADAMTLPNLETEIETALSAVSQGQGPAGPVGEGWQVDLERWRHDLLQHRLHP